MNHRFLPFLLAVFLLMTAACGGDEPEPTAVPPTPTEAPAAIEAPTVEPAAEGQPESPLAAPESPLAAPESPLAAPESPLPPPAEEVPVEGAAPASEAVVSESAGAVRGRLAIHNGAKPVAQMKIALAELIRNDAGEPRVAGYDPATSLSTTSDDAGVFVISEVPPGTYGIIVDAIITSILLGSPETGDSYLIEVKPGEVTEMGDLLYEALPLPGYNE